jgi:adenosylcobinamide-GDP ribazoletransferase
MPREPVEPGQTAIFFPLTGAILGVAGAGVYLLGARVLPGSLAALLTVLFWTGISGVLRERPVDDAAIVKESDKNIVRNVPASLNANHIGTLGALAVLLSVLLRWQALAHVDTSRLFQICIASQAVPRAGFVALAWVSRPVGNGRALAFCSTLNTSAAVAAIVQGILAALLCGIRPALVIVVGTYLILRMARWCFYRWMGGVTGDGLDATEQVLEISILALFTCANCFWQTA